MAEVVIRRVIQQQPNGFIFQTRSPRLTAFKVVLDPRLPALYASEARPPMESPGSDFLMILRKHLTSAELISFTKPLSERVVEMTFKTVVPARDLETVSLVIELLPNSPNLILLDAERRVIASWLPITAQHEIAEYEPYQLPTSGGKIDLARILTEDVPALEGFSTADDPKYWLISNIAGLGPVFAAELVYRQKKSGNSITTEIRDLLTQVSTISPNSWIYTDLPLSHVLESNDLQRLGKAIISPVQLQSLDRSHSAKTFGSILEAARFYFDEMESRTLLEQAKAPLLKELKEGLKRFADREKRLAKEQQKYEDAAGLHQTAQSLTPSGLKMEQHYDSVMVKDYFAEKPTEVRVALDPKLSLRENIDRMFKRHSKAGRGKGMVAKQLSTSRLKREQLDEQYRRLQAIRDWDTWLAISGRLNKEKAAPVGEAAVKEMERPHLRGVRIDGREIYIGRNGRENDEVTFHIAAPDDFWLHVADYSGSHVVVRNPAKDRDLEAEVLVKAAQLAAFYSQARNSSKVEVHYTRRRHVSKPKRAKAGMVKLQEFKSISVEPKNWLA